MKESRYESGSWNIQCDWCSQKIKASRARKTWDGFYVCPEHWEPRQPLDFLKGVKDKQSVPFTRPESPYVFITAGTIQTNEFAIAGVAIAGVAVAGYGVIIDTGHS